jgi:hypothetical protein
MLNKENKEDIKKLIGANNEDRNNLRGLVESVNDKLDE